MKLKHLAVILAVGALGLGTAACGGDPTKTTDTGSTSTDTVTVGSADFPESQIIAEIYAQALEAKDIKVSKKLNIGAREIYIPALKNGEIGLIPDYSGNLLSYFDKKATATSAADVESALTKAVPDGLAVLDESPAEDKDSLNVTPQFAQQHNVKSIADLKSVNGLRLAANPEFKTRPYGIPGLEKVYGITGVTFTGIKDGGGPNTLKALLDNKVDVADIYTTTPSIKANKLVTLEDPKNLIAAQRVVPVINSSKVSDKAKETINAVSAKLTTDDLVAMNAENQGDKKTAPATLAKQWLQDKGLA
jgi:osmoprotectant transport system substrate-binding protein